MSEENREECCQECPPEPGRKRRRGLTSVALQWVAERFRRAEQVKEQIATGTYKVESDKIAKAILSAEGE